jgi:hypothetical protein
MKGRSSYIRRAALRISRHQFSDTQNDVSDQTHAYYLASVYTHLAFHLPKV